MKLSRAGWCLAAFALLCSGLSAADSGDLSQQLADTQDRLATALHSYTLLQDENQKLADQMRKAAAQLAAVREQLRQARDQVAALAQQNYELRNQLAGAPAPRK